MVRGKSMNAIPSDGLNPAPAHPIRPARSERCVAGKPGICGVPQGGFYIADGGRKCVSVRLTWEGLRLPLHAPASVHALRPCISSGQLALQMGARHKRRQQVLIQLKASGYLSGSHPVWLQCGNDCTACKDAQTCTQCENLSQVGGKCTRCEDPRCKDCTGNAAVCRTCKDARHVPDPNTKRCRLKVPPQKVGVMPAPGSGPGPRSR